MQTYAGVQFWPLDPRPEEIVWQDIASALSKMCRFGGHTHTFYSVAEHCVLMSRWIEDKTGDRKLALAALLHDAAEAYVGDMVRPLKQHMPDFKAVEQRLMDMIAMKVGLNDIYPGEVREADNRILLDERKAVLGPKPAEWFQDIEGIEPLGVHIEALPWWRARYEWAARLQGLAGVEAV